ncbi:MAG: polysaccharide pyruvyl transferase family protein, partial [Bacteroidales bacterium]
PPKGNFKDFVDEAKFYFTRETASYENLKNAGVKCNLYGFAPDATFGSNVQDTYQALMFMKEHGLEYKKFLCVVPRLRVTPYYLIAPSLKHHKEPWSQERIQEVDELNNKHKEEDHAKARSAIVAYVRRTGNPVLLCPEMVHNMDLFDELLYNPLPDEIKKKVIKRTSFWRTDEATTVYKNAAAVISFEAHSPILAYMQGTPAFYLRQPEDTIKGQMYYDIGLSDWVFEIEDTKAQDIVDCLMEVVNDYQSACEKLEFSMDYVRDLQRKCMLEIRKAVGLNNSGY